MTRVPLVDIAAQEATVATEVLRAVERVAQSGQFVLGAEVDAFERWLAHACGATFAVGVASGTDALALGLRALGVGPGDAVITPALSFVAAAEAVVRVGASPVFCDVEADTMNASERCVDAALDRARREGLRVRAILPVHLFGQCAPTGLRVLSTKVGAALLEDAAQAIGARDDLGGPAGGGADAACFSFFPTKNLGAWGDGGALVTSRHEVMQRVRRLRAHGAVAPYVHAEVGCNSRLDAVQAAVLMAKAPRLATWQRARTERAARYGAELGGLALTLPRPPPPPAVHAWHAYVIHYEGRDALAHWLRDHGVDARVYYPVPLHRQACFASLAPAALPTAEALCRTALALPLFPLMSEAQQSHVIDVIVRFFARAHAAG